MEKDGTVDEVKAPDRGLMVRADDGLRVRSEDVVEREYAIPHNAKLLVENGQPVRAGDPITDGPINPPAREEAALALGHDHRRATGGPHGCDPVFGGLADVQGRGCAHHVTDADRPQVAAESVDDHLQPDRPRDDVVASHHQRDGVLRSQGREDVGNGVVGIALRAERDGQPVQLRHR